MELILQSDKIAGAPEEFLSQYGNGRYGHTEKIAAMQELIARGPPYTQEEIEAVLARGWTRIRCDECGNESPCLVRFGDEPDYGARWQDLCIDCLKKAVDTLDSQRSNHEATKGI